MRIETMIKEIILSRLDLEDRRSEINENTRLFSGDNGGLDLDSLASLDILAGLSEKFGLPFDDIEAQDFQTISTIAIYLRANGIAHGDDC